MSSQIRYLALRERAHRPVRGESTAEIFEAILNCAPVAPVRLNPNLPPKLEDIVSRATIADFGKLHLPALQGLFDQMRRLRCRQGR